MRKRKAPTCAYCGQPVDGYAAINDDWYCHPDDEGKPDCYSLASMSVDDRIAEIVRDPQAYVDKVRRENPKPRRRTHD